MDSIVVAFGRVAIASYLRAYLATCQLALYANNRGTPLVGDTLANYTEATFPGYARVNLTTWGAAFLNASNQGETDELLHTFTRSSSGTVENIYGFLILDGSSNLVAVSRNPTGPVPVTNAGDGYSVQPKHVEGTLC